MKICSGCKELKEPTEFNRCKSTKDGLQYSCKICVRKSALKFSKKWKLENLDKFKLSKKNWQSNNPEKSARYNSKWKKENSGKWNAIAARYRAAKLNATPQWLTEDQFKEIEEFYIIAEELSWLSESPLEVDHIVPLQGKDLSGLHVPWNLQVIPKSQNCSKGNR